MKNRSIYSLPSFLILAVLVGSSGQVCSQHTEREPLEFPAATVDHQLNHELDQNRQNRDRLILRLEQLEHPGFAFYWGEWLSADFREQRHQVIEGSVDRHSTSDGSFDYRQADYWHSSSSSSERLRLVARMEAFSESRLSGLGQEGIWQLESAFVTSLARSRLRLVDPELVTRLQSSIETEQEDRRRLETSALIDRTRYVLEVLGRRDAASDTGWLFRVRVTDLQDGRRLIDFSTAAAPAQAAPGPCIASDRGFERAMPTPISLADIGQALASQLVNSLAEVL